MYYGASAWVDADDVPENCGCCGRCSECEAAFERMAFGLEDFIWESSLFAGSDLHRIYGPAQDQPEEVEQPADEVALLPCEACGIECRGDWSGIPCCGSR